MTLPTGATLGRYEIVSTLGAGGMGEVYRARDSRLGREVAVKVLPLSFAADPERLRRFEQEARAVAALSDPNILAVHDIGQHDGAPFLVSELLEGETLHDILMRGAISHRKAIDYAVQMAHGLAAAHSKDIAHRDLKPGNIFITKEGRVKILDFGLAKTVQKASAFPSEAVLATITVAEVGTDVGTVVGTASYMSPEQVRGIAVDCRTDIFSFGAVLYEMLSGKRAFKRDTTAETMTAILKDDPEELLDSGRQIPPVLDRIVRHCMEKAPEQRFQSARDLAFDLESITTLTATGSLPAAKVEKRRRAWYAAAMVVLLIAAGLLGWKISGSARTATGSQFHQLTYRRGTVGDARFTPDGQNIVYTAAWEGSDPELYTVPANSVSGHTLDIKNARLLAISKNGELAVSLAPRQLTTLLSPGTLARASNGSGAPKPEIENVQSADYTPDGSALAIVRYLPADQMCQLEYPLNKVLYKEQLIDNLRFSPDGRYLAFMTHTNASDDRGSVVVLRSTGEKILSSPLFESAQGIAWSPSGDEVWFSSPLESGKVHAISLSGKLRDPLAVPGRVRLQDVSRDGRLLVEQGIVRRGMIIADRHGESQHDLSWLDFSYLRAISDDGKTILFEEEGNQTPGYTVFVRGVDGSPAIPIGEGYGLALSPDKKWALAAKLSEPNHEIWLLPVGAGEPRRLTPSNFQPVIAARFLADGKNVAYIASESGRPPRVWMQDLTGGKPHPVTPEGIAGNFLSPDDRWLVVRDVAFLKPPQLFSLGDASFKNIQGLGQKEVVLGWTSDNQLFIGSRVAGQTLAQIYKLNPNSGTRELWTDVTVPPFGGVMPDLPIITPDGNTYGFDYRLHLSDLYTVSGIR